MKLFTSKGFLNNAVLGKRQPSEYEFDGKKLDELIIAATIKSVQDVEFLIKYLQVHKYCFLQPEDQ